jgi:hypothetical protein
MIRVQPDELINQFGTGFKSVDLEQAHFSAKQSCSTLFIFPTVFLVPGYTIQ